MFMTASQDCLIRLYDTNNDIFFLRDEIAAIDVAVSHSGDCLVYSSWCENLHCVKIGSHVADRDKRTHFPLPLAPDDGSFCMFCVTFSEVIRRSLVDLMMDAYTFMTEPLIRDLIKYMLIM